MRSFRLTLRTSMGCAQPKLSFHTSSFTFHSPLFPTFPAEGGSHFPAQQGGQSNRPAHRGDTPPSVPWDTTPTPPHTCSIPSKTFISPIWRTLASATDSTRESTTHDRPALQQRAHSRIPQPQATATHQRNQCPHHRHGQQ